MRRVSSIEGHFQPCRHLHAVNLILNLFQIEFLLNPKCLATRLLETQGRALISKGSEATKHHQQATCQKKKKKKKKLLEKTMIPMPTLLYVCMEFELGLLWWEKDLILKLLRFTYKLLLHKFAPGLSTSFRTAKSGATKSALMTREDCYYASIFGAQLGSHPHCRWIPPSPRREDCWCVYCHVGFVFSMHAASRSKGDAWRGLKFESWQFARKASSVLRNATNALVVP